GVQTCALPIYLASEILTEDNKVLGTYYVANRSNVKYSELSPYLVKALISTETNVFTATPALIIPERLPLSFIPCWAISREEVPLHSSLRSTFFRKDGSGTR